MCLFLSCMSLQKDLTVSENIDEEKEFISKIEIRIADVDGNVFFQSSDADNKAKDDSTLKDLVMQIKRKLDQANLTTPVTARLNALLGRVYLLQKNSDEAKKQYAFAKKKSSSDSQVIILGSRLGFETDLEKEIERSGGEPLLILESALSSYASGSYEESAAKFDTAFLSLGQEYKNSYKKIRDTAWSLRELSSPDIQLASLLAVNTLSLVQMVQITTISSHLLDGVTAGKKMTNTKLFTEIQKSGFLNSRSGTDSSQYGNSLRQGDMAKRVLAARFLWNLYAARNPSVSVLRYSSKYRMNKSSATPVPDISLSSEDFDAVLGCVENELMFLPDGRSFNPDGIISGRDFYSAVKKIQ